MGEIIKFYNPKKQQIEDELINSLDEYQLELFSQLAEQILKETEELYLKFASKCVECEELKIEIEKLKGEKNNEK